MVGQILKPHESFRDTPRQHTGLPGLHGYPVCYNDIDTGVADKLIFIWGNLDALGFIKRAEHSILYNMHSKYFFLILYICIAEE